MCFVEQTFKVWLSDVYSKVLSDLRQPCNSGSLDSGGRTPLCCFPHLFPLAGPTKPQCVFMYMEEQKVLLKLTAEAQHDNKSPTGECM